MHADLAKRLQKVGRVLQLLKKLAISEGEWIQRASKRSVMALQKAVGKFEEALNRLSSDQKAKAQVLALIEQVIGQAGVVNQEAIESTKKPFDAIRATHEVAPQLAGAAARLMAAAFMAARMQNSDRVELAMIDPRHQKTFFRAQEKLTEALQRMDQLTREIQFPAEPQEPAKKEEEQGAPATDALANQINEAHADMLNTVQAMAKALLTRVKYLFPDDIDLLDALHQNMTAAMPGGEPGQSKKVNEALNRKPDFYRDVLELQKGSDYDLGEFLRTKNRKLIYQAWRSLVMAMRALGVMQWAKARPDAVAKSDKALELLIKAQQILKKRKALVVDRLNRLEAEEDEEDEEGGVPKGTFQQSFEETPKGTFDSAA